MNGEEMELPADLTVGGLIERMGLSNSICAAEVDGQVVPRRERDGLRLLDGQRVEIVTLVGGG